MARTGNPYGLTDLVWHFVQEYLVDLNGAQAYARAGYKARGNVAEAAASRLLRNVKVVAALQAEQQKRAERVQLSQDAVLEELHLLSHSNIEDYRIDDQGNVMLASGVHKRAMRAVSSLQKKIIHTENGPIYETRIWLWNKPASVKMAGEHLGAFERKLIESADVQAAQAQREAALLKVRQQLDQIKARHQQAAEVMPI